MEPSRRQNPTVLPVGTEVWPWRVLGLSGQGTCATVPRLLDVGWWRAPDGTSYPFLVLEWVGGVELYEWAEQPGRTWGQRVRVLAQVASALTAVHAVKAVHRDIQGENVLVREDGSAVLVGFGSGDWSGARPLARPGEPPGAPQYWSPELLRFQWEKRGEREAHSEAGPADDVYALGMMAWRLVTGRYPEAMPAPGDVGEGERLRRPVPSPQTLAGAGPELKELMLRMLSPEPQARGSAAEVLRALERAEEKAGSQARRPLRASPEAVADVGSPWEVAGQWTRGRRRELRVAAAALGLAVGLWSVELLVGGRAIELAQPALEEGGGDAGTTELADTAVSGSESAKERGEPKPSGFRLEVPKAPRPGQLRPPCKPPRVEINGGCWGHLIGEKPPCGDGAYEWGGRVLLARDDHLAHADLGASVEAHTRPLR